MGLKFAIQPDHIPVNNYRLIINGLQPITFVSIGALEKEMDKVDLPDRTTASTGRTKPGETEVKVPAHHQIEVQQLESWFVEGKDPISPTYKKTGTLTMYSGTRLTTSVMTLIGAWISKGATPDLEMNDDGEMAVLTYTLCWDDILGLG
ncbi:MAG: hypothetical protein GWM98_26755 [Nitrospinaceae bacterium]|nr:hypothetical protein [Nitrospinaceae bacterium]